MGVVVLQTLRASSVGQDSLTETALLVLWLSPGLLPAFPFFFIKPQTVRAVRIWAGAVFAFATLVTLNYFYAPAVVAMFIAAMLAVKRSPSEEDATPKFRPDDEPKIL